jgi:hypothetical protein
MKEQSIVDGQRVEKNGVNFNFLTENFIGQQVGNIPTLVLENYLKTNPKDLVLKDNNRLYSTDGLTRYATVFAILDKDGKVLLVNRNAQEQEIINDGIDLSHAGATIHPISIHYKLGQMNDPEVFSVLGAKITSVEFANYAEEDISSDDETKCIMPVWTIKTDFDSESLKCFYDLDKIDSLVTAKVAAIK